MDLRARVFDAFATRPPAGRILRPEAESEGGRLRELLAAMKPNELSPQDMRNEVASNLWMLTPEAYRYFLPAFLAISLEAYEAVSVFVSELVGALTEPARADVVETLDRLDEIPSGVGLPPGMTKVLREQQLAWFDSGSPAAIFHERHDSLTPAEGAVVLAFLTALREAHGGDFPFAELDTAIARYWIRYREG